MLNTNASNRYLSLSGRVPFTILLIPTIISSLGSQIRGRTVTAAYTASPGKRFLSSPSLLRKTSHSQNSGYPFVNGLNCFRGELPASQLKPSTTTVCSSHLIVRMSSSDNDVVSTPSIAENLEFVKEKMKNSIEACGRNLDEVQLVAVSKTKPVELLVEAYEAGQLHFGENYAQELLQKSETLADKDDIAWHFIGPLQSNKAAALVKGVGKKLVCVESVATRKLAQKLDRAAREVDESFRLGVFLQVNTSGESSKSGLDLEDVVPLAMEVNEMFPNLSLNGLMTIGAPGDFGCFDTLVACRENVAEALGREPSSLELSMGMSGDFEEAIKRGATNVRVGSTIFGQRDYSQK